jgi:hypothetical protein
LRRLGGGDGPRIARPVAFTMELPMRCGFPDAVHAFAAAPEGCAGKNCCGRDRRHNLFLRQSADHGREADWLPQELRVF